MKDDNKNYKRLKEIFLKYLTDGFKYAAASKPADGFTGCSKIKIRPVFIKNQNMYQITRTVGNKELHENRNLEETAVLLEEAAGKSFLNIDVENSKGKLCVMVSKKGHITVKEHMSKSQNDMKSQNDRKTENTDTDERMQHNRTKKYLLPDGIPVPFLVELGVMTGTGKVVAQKYDKFRQINRYLEFVEDIIDQLPKNREIRIIDFGCGKSYLTFAMYYYLHDIKKIDARIIGLDLKTDVIEKCSNLAGKFGYDKLQFLQGDIAGYEAEDKKSPDMVVTLHACDTATDYTLEKAIKWGARVIMCVPCCQHELNKQIECEELKPVMKYGLLKERFAALVTDGLRAEMLEEAGYRTQILEFIDMEHTPKNILIRAVRQPLKIKKHTGYEKTVEFLHVKPALQRLLNDC